MPPCARAAGCARRSAWRAGCRGPPVESQAVRERGVQPALDGADLVAVGQALTGDPQFRERFDREARGTLSNKLIRSEFMDRDCDSLRLGRSLESAATTAPTGQRTLARNALRQRRLDFAPQCLITSAGFRQKRSARQSAASMLCDKAVRPRPRLSLSARVGEFGGTPDTHWCGSVSFVIARNGYKSLILLTRCGSVSSCAKSCRLATNQEVAGSSPAGRAIDIGSVPVTWVTVHSEHIGNTFGLNGFHQRRRSSQCTILRLIARMLRWSSMPSAPRIINAAKTPATSVTACACTMVTPMPRWAPRNSATIVPSSE